MSTVTNVCRALRWAVRTAEVWRCPLSPGCRGLCQPLIHHPLRRTHQNQGLHPPSTCLSESGLSPRSLIEMGFTDTEAEHVCASVSQLRGVGATNALSTLTALFALGLNATSIVKVLDKSAEVYAVKEAQLQQRITNLRKIGLVEGSLQRVVVHYPQILTVPAKRIRNVAAFLREKCLFTVQQVTRILRDSPAIVMENTDHLQYKFQYVYFRMGVKQAEMVKSKLFHYTLDEVRNKHSFLERRGLYQTPDKKGQTIITNPKLDSVFNSDEDTFLEMASASAEEYDVFKRLMEREWQQEQQQLGSFGANSVGEEEEDDDDDDNDEEQEEEEETAGRNGYRKRIKRT